MAEIREEFTPAAMGVSVAATLMLLALALRALGYLVYATAAERLDLWRDLIFFPWVHSDVLLPAVAIGAGAWLAAAGTATAHRIYWLLAAAFAGTLFLDAASYAAILSPLDPSLLAGESAVGVVRRIAFGSAAVWPMVALWLAASWWLWQTIVAGRVGRHSRWIVRRAAVRPAQWILGVFLTLTVAVDAAVDFHRLDRHGLLQYALGQYQHIAGSLAAAPQPAPFRARYGHPDAAVLQYFHDRSHWGVRDGSWEFSAAMLGGGEELFNLARDPGRLHNLAQAMPGRVRLYEELCATWFSRLEQAEAPEGFVHYYGGWWRRSHSPLPGLKHLNIGIYDGEPEWDEGFQSLARVNPWEPVVARLHWLPLADPLSTSIEWRHPDGSVESYHHYVQADWTHTWSAPGIDLPLQEGRWRVTARLNGETLAVTDFWVTADAPLRIQPAVGARKFAELAVGSQAGGEFTASQTLPAGAVPVAWIRWEDAAGYRIADFHWEAPDGTTVHNRYGIRSAWDQTWYAYDGPQPLTPGRWSLRVSMNGEVLGTAHFRVVGDAAPEAAP